MNWKKLTALGLSAVLAGSLLAGCAPKEGEQGGKREPQLNESERFDAFLTEEFVEEVSDNLLDLHFSLRYPEKYHIQDVPVTLGSLELDRIEENERELDDLQKKLLSFQKEELTQQQQLDYDVLRWNLETGQKMDGLTYYGEPLTSTGVQASMPSVMAEYALYSEQDVQDYIGLLNDIPRYFKEIEEFEQKKSEQGLFMADFAVDDLVESMEQFVEDPESNFMIQVFDDRLAQVEGISEEKRQEYRDANRKAVLESVIPAYQSLIERMKALKGTGTNDGGLCRYPEGEAYYRALVERSLGTSRTLEELDEWLDEEIFQNVMELLSVAQEHPDALDQWGEWDLEERTPEEVMKALQALSAAEFPELREVAYEIKTVAPAMQKISAPAFYLVPPIDEETQNFIYINPSYEVDNAKLFTTLAHEGYPGHLYQNNYYKSREFHPIRRLLETSGYSEGWASYVEMISYGWADPENPALTELSRIDAQLSLLVYSKTDLAVHFLDWGEEELSEYLGKYGLGDPDMVRLIREAVIEDPANYLCYGVGMLEFQELREHAEKWLGDDFDPVEFHRVILDCGPAPFDVVGDCVERYIDGAIGGGSRQQAA